MFVVLKIKNEDVLRTVVALLDTSLPDIGPRDIHETVHWQGVHTLILARDHAGTSCILFRSLFCINAEPNALLCCILLPLADVLAEYSGKRPKTKGRPLWPAPAESTETTNSIHSMLANLYSDSEEEIEKEEDSEESSEESSSEEREYRYHKKYFHFDVDTLYILACKDSKYSRFKLKPT